MTNLLDRNITAVLSALVGSWRRFGTEGPVYQIVSIGTASVDDRPTLRIHVLESGEELDYPLAKALDDPHER